MTTSLVRTRHAVIEDVDTVFDLYARCSPRTLHHRFHVPMARIPARMVRRLVVPADGWSQVGLLVDDAARRGFEAMVCTVEPDNESVLPTVRRAGLQGVPIQVDGVVEIELALAAHRAGLPRIA